MSRPAQIVDAIGDLLSGHATLTAYVKTFLIGKRSQMVKFPALLVDQVSIAETDLTYGTQDMHIRVLVLGAVQVTNKDKQIVGDDNTKGILDLENDVKKVLSSDRTLGGLAIHMAIGETTYDDTEYPIKGFALEIDVHFRQNTTLRT